MFLEQISWAQAKEYFEKNDVAIIPVGSTENHGSQLALGTDFIIPRKLCEMIDEKLNYLITPTIPFGVADHHMHFPGTITIGYDGLYDLVSRVVDELYEDGIRHFVFLNGHGGNNPVLERICLELDNCGALGAMLNWWQLAGELNPAWKGGHAGGEETAAMMAINPDYVHMDYFKPFIPKDLSKDLTFVQSYNVNCNGITVPVPRHVNRYTESGWYGPDSPETATKEWGEEMLAATADFLADFIKKFAAVAPYDAEK